MGRPVTLFTGQWTDLPFEEVCRKAAAMGYDGLEIACWGDHLDVEKAATDRSYVAERKKILEKNGLGCWALGTHIIGKVIGDVLDKRHYIFAPAELNGKPDEVRQWGIRQMKHAAAAAANMGCSVATGFMGSPIWNFLYSFPATTDEMVDDGFREIVELWNPILDEFDRHKVKFALEVHSTEIAYDYYTARRLLDEFDHRPALGFNFDPSHLLWQGLDPKIIIDEFPDRIYHVHMKDVSVTRDGKAGILGSHLPFGDLRRGWNFRSLGHGDVDFESIIRSLNAAGYTGPLSVEWEDNGMEREFGAKESVDFVRRYNFTPSSVAFDRDMKR
ncbi:sugar phosphate isomerase/epimerase family protein [Salinispira pacifica]